MKTTGFLARARVLAATAALSAAVTLTIAGCTSSDAPKESASGRPVTQATVRPTQNPAASEAASAPAVAGGVEPTQNPAQPSIADLQGIAATALASVSQVVQLHDTAVAAGHPGTIPASVIPLTAQGIATTLKQQVTATTRLDPGTGTPPADLAAGLQKYGKLATQLARWDSSTAKPLPAAYFTDLAAADKQWQAALKSIGALAGQDLLANMPPLLFPTN